MPCAQASGAPIATIPQGVGGLTSRAAEVERGSSIWTRGLAAMRRTSLRALRASTTFASPRTQIMLLTQNARCSTPRARRSARTGAWVRSAVARSAATTASPLARRPRSERASERSACSSRTTRNSVLPPATTCSRTAASTFSIAGSPLDADAADGLSQRLHVERRTTGRTSRRTGPTARDRNVLGSERVIPRRV